MPLKYFSTEIQKEGQPFKIRLLCHIEICLVLAPAGTRQGTKR